MLRKIICLCLSLILSGIFPGISGISAAPESVSLTTYYPSPLGNYNEIDVYNKTTANQSMVLSATGSLQTTSSQTSVPAVPGAGVQTSIGSDGNISTPRLDFNSNTTAYMRVLRAKDITTASIVDESGTAGKWRVPTWQVQPWTAFKPLLLTPFPVSHDCETAGPQPGLLNSVQGESGVLPLCIAIPIQLPVVLVICTGTETIRMKFRCINPT